MLAKSEREAGEEGDEARGEGSGGGGGVGGGGGGGGGGGAGGLKVVSCASGDALAASWELLLDWDLSMRMRSICVKAWGG